MGYKDALSANDIEVRPNFIHLCTKNIIRAKEYLTHLHDSGEDFDAVITSDDSLAVGAVKYALASRISIPDELSIVGYNDSMLAICTEPEITSIDTRLEELCTTAVDRLMKVFSGSESEAGETVTYGLFSAQERGTLFVGPGEKVYSGMVIGQNGKAEDLSLIHI